MSQEQNNAVRIAQFLPWTLLFPIGVTYAGFVVFIAACLVQHDRGAWAHRMSTHPMFLPIISLSLVSSLIAVYHGPALYHPTDFVSAWSHFQVYLLLLPLLGLQPGVWQEKGRQHFIWTGVAIGGIFFCAWLGVLPEHKIFNSFVIYEGNKSILLALCLALAAAWQWDLLIRRVYPSNLGLQCIRFAFLVVALLMFSKSRTALLLLILLILFSGFQWMGRRAWLDWRAAVLGVVLLASAVFAWKYISQLERPPICEVRKVQGTPLELARLRLICTVQQVNEFSQGKTISEDGIRLELYKYTAEIVADSPWLGHGVGSWLGLYERKAIGKVSQKMTTPHNEFLLFMTEVGIIGLLPLLWIWWTQAKMAWQLSYQEPADKTHLGSSLAMLTFGILFCACFNAAIRDLVFAVPFILLSGFFLAGIRAHQVAFNDQPALR